MPTSDKKGSAVGLFFFRESIEKSSTYALGGGSLNAKDQLVMDIYHQIET